MSTKANTPSAIATFVIKSDGKVIKDDFNILSVQIQKRINQIATAKISILNGNPSTAEFKASSCSTFVPGKELSIEAGYDSENTLVFRGIITQQRIKVDAVNGSLLEVECRDEAIKMAVGRKSLTFSKKKDSDIIKSIIENYSRLKANVTATTTQWPEQVQYYVSDWDFILSRAEVNGMVVSTINGEVAVFPPDKSTESVLNIKYGDNLLEFNAQLNSVNQLGSVKASSWDFKNQTVNQAMSQSSYKGPGNLSTKQLSQVIGLKEYELQTTSPLQTTDLTNWTKAELVKSEYAKIQGEVKFQGSSQVDPGKYITLCGLGDRFNGDYFISGVSHVIQSGNWTTEATLGLSTTWVTQASEVMAPPASGLLPGVQGIFNGTVKKIYEDPDNEYRILVDVPMFDKRGEGIWARLTNFYSTSNAGAFFLPEEGDEVVVGFLNEDPRYPIILGSLYSSKNNRPFKGLTPNEKNSKKAIVSKEGIYIEFDDENKVFTINTPSENQAIFSDKDKKITIKDQNGNVAEMSSSGVVIKSPNNITIEASEKLTLKGNTGVDIQSSVGDVNIQGLNISNNADASFSAKGSVEAELKGGAQTTIKGAMVMIN
jgi:Rhs element Vgr protein